jgi:hypothetical protein
MKGKLCSIFLFFLFVESESESQQSFETTFSSSSSSSSSSPLLSPFQVWQWREEAREMLEHSFGSYMQHAYPLDELKPLSCVGRRWDQRERGNLDDSLGGFSLTLIDSLDSLAVMGDLPGFRCAVSRVVKDVGFANRSVVVSVFETAIRVIGGLLSAHILSVDEKLGIWREGCLHRSVINGDENSSVSDCSLSCSGDTSLIYACDETLCLQKYDGQLLYMARELALRLLPAFDTPSGLPYHRINLHTGVVDPSSRESCTAAAGTHLLEFGVLSRLTGDPSFEAVSRRAVNALWHRKAPLTGLIGSAIDVVDGTWRTQHSGVGAGIDSFIEYLLKAGIALDDDSLIQMHSEQSDAIRKHMTRVGNMHLEVSMSTGGLLPSSSTSAASIIENDMKNKTYPYEQDDNFEDDSGALGSNRRTYMFPYASSLQAFYPALEVLSGHVAEAREHYLPLAALWSRFDALPEQFDTQADVPLNHGKDSPLRPELIESNYYLYTASRDPSYLHRAATHMRALNRDSRVACGFASVADITVTLPEYHSTENNINSAGDQKEIISSMAQSGVIPGRRRRLDDRMDSFFVAETVKYLFKTFDHALWHWCEGPTLGISWNATTCVQSWPRLQTKSSIFQENIKDDNHNNYSYYNNLLDKLFPRAHSLAFDVRQRRGYFESSSTLVNDINNNIDPMKDMDNLRSSSSLSSLALSSLPLDELRTLYSTEGHLFLLGSWSSSSIRIHSNASRSNTRKNNQRIQPSPSPSLQTSSTSISSSTPVHSLTSCPRLSPHPRAGEPPLISSKIAESALIYESTFSREENGRSGQGLHSPISFEGKTNQTNTSSNTQQGSGGASSFYSCSVATVLDAMPFLNGNQQNLNDAVFHSATSPFAIQGSADLDPSFISTYYSSTIRPSIQQAFAAHSSYQNEINQRQSAANAVAAALSFSSSSSPANNMHAANGGTAASFLGSFMSAISNAFVANNPHAGSNDGGALIMLREGYTSSITAYANDPPGQGFSLTPWTTVQILPMERLTGSLNAVGWTRRIASSITFTCGSPPMFQGQPLPQISCNVHIDTSSSSPSKTGSRNLRISVRNPTGGQWSSLSERPTGPPIPSLRWSEKQSSAARILEEKGHKEFEKVQQHLQQHQHQQQQQQLQQHQQQQGGGQVDYSTNAVDESVLLAQTIDNHEEQSSLQGNSHLLLLTPASPALFGPILTTYGLHGLLPIFAHPRSACSDIQPPPAGFQYVLVAIRGGCTFAQKAFTAQNSGFSALLVLDLLSNDDFAALGGVADFMMADDGYAVPSTQQSNNDPSKDSSVSSHGLGLYVTIPSALVSGESAKALSLTFLEGGQGTLDMMIDEAVSIKERGWQVPAGTAPAAAPNVNTASSQVVHPDIVFFSYPISIFGDALANEEATSQPIFPPPSTVAHHSKVIGDAFSHAFENLPNESLRGEKLKALYPNPYADIIV